MDWNNNVKKTDASPSFLFMSLRTSAHTGVAIRFLFSQGPASPTARTFPSVQRLGVDGKELSNALLQRPMLRLFQCWVISQQLFCRLLGVV